MTWVSQGAIADRTREMLVDTDRGIVLYRRMLLGAGRARRRGARSHWESSRDETRTSSTLAQESHKYGDGAAFLAEALDATHVRYSPLRDQIIELLREPAR